MTRLEEIKKDSGWHDEEYRALFPDEDTFWLIAEVVRLRGVVVNLDQIAPIFESRPQTKTKTKLVAVVFLLMVCGIGYWAYTVAVH